MSEIENKKKEIDISRDMQRMRERHISAWSTDCCYHRPRDTSSRRLFVVAEETICVVPAILSFLDNLFCECFPLRRLSDHHYSLTSINFKNTHQFIGAVLLCLVIDGKYCLQIQLLNRWL